MLRNKVTAAVGAETGKLTFGVPKSPVVPLEPAQGKDEVPEPDDCETKPPFTPVIACPPLSIDCADHLTPNSRLNPSLASTMRASIIT